LPRSYRVKKYFSRTKIIRFTTPRRNLNQTSS
jgi:hypothetical protein